MSDFNPSVRQIPRSQLADVIPERRDASILSWLERSGRLISREAVEVAADEADSEEISDLMGGEDSNFDDDDDMSLGDDS